MKKCCFAAVCAVLVVAVLGAQEGGGLLNVGDYSKLFLNAGGKIDSKYLRVASRDEKLVISAFDGDTTMVDTPLEIALLSTCAGVVDIRPAEAVTMLGNAKQADLKLGAAVYQEMQVLRFLGDTAAAGRHEAMLQFITGRGNVSRAEIEAYLRGGIAAVVDAEFGKTTQPSGEIQAVKDILAAFFINPNTITFNAVRDVSLIYMITVMATFEEKKKASIDVANAYDNTLQSLNPNLLAFVSHDVVEDFNVKSGTDNIITLANLVRQYIR